MPKKVKQQHKSNDQELIELGQMLKSLYETGYVSKKHALGYTFIKGMVQGVGLFVGGTLVVAIGLWFLSQFTELPIIGPFSEALRRSTQQ